MASSIVTPLLLILIALSLTSLLYFSLTSQLTPIQESPTFAPLLIEAYKQEGNTLVLYVRNPSPSEATLTDVLLTVGDQVVEVSINQTIPPNETVPLSISLPPTTSDEVTISLGGTTVTEITINPDETQFLSILSFSLPPSTTSPLITLEANVSSSSEYNYTLLLDGTTIDTNTSSASYHRWDVNLPSEGLYTICLRVEMNDLYDESCARVFYGSITDLYAPWPQFRKDSKNTGYLPLGYKGYPYMKLMWKFSTPSLVYASPVIGDIDFDGNYEVIAADMNGNLYIIGWDGSLERSINLGSPIRSTPAIDDIDGDGNFEIVVGGDDRNVYVIRNGIVSVLFTAPNPLISPIKIIDENGVKRIMFHALGGSIYVLDSNGSTLVSIPINSSHWIALAADDIDKDTQWEIVASSEYGVYAYENTGTSKWSYSLTLGTDGVVTADIDADTNVEVFFATYLSPSLIILNATTGGVESTLSLPSNVTQGLPLYVDIDGDTNNELVGVTISWGLGENGAIVAYSEDGNLLWSIPISSGIVSSPVALEVDEDGAYEIIVAKLDGTIFVIDGDGRILSKIRISDTVVSSPALADLDNDGRLEAVIGARDGVYAIDFVPSLIRIEEFNVPLSSYDSNISIYANVFSSGYPFDYTLTLNGSTVVSSTSSSSTLSLNITLPSPGTHTVCLAVSNGVESDATCKDVNYYIPTPSSLVGWSYRVPIDINSSRNEVDIVLKLFIDTNSLISAGKMLADCNDLRFTYDDGVTPLPYWLEGPCNDTNTIVWVRIPKVSFEETTRIYMYYGNPSAISESNGDATFLFFDDFEGNTIDTNKWIDLAGKQWVCSANRAIGSVSVGGSWVSITVDGYGLHTLVHPTTLEAGKEYIAVIYGSGQAVVAENSALAEIRWHSVRSCRGIYPYAYWKSDRLFYERTTNVRRETLFIPPVSDLNLAITAYNSQTTGTTQSWYHYVALGKTVSNVTYSFGVEEVI